MKCPNCKEVDLTLAERQGVEIDYCPRCRGVWLDRGELDKLLERNAQYEAANYRRDDDDDDDDDKYKRRQPPPQMPQHGGYQAPSAPPQYDPRYDPRYDPKYKKKGFLREIFDWD